VSYLKDSYMCNQRLILNIRWYDKVQNVMIMAQTSSEQSKHNLSSKNAPFFFTWWGLLHWDQLASLTMSLMYCLDHGPCAFSCCHCLCDWSVPAILLTLAVIMVPAIEVRYQFLQCAVELKINCEGKRHGIQFFVVHCESDDRLNHLSVSNRSNITYLFYSTILGANSLCNVDVPLSNKWTNLLY